MRNKLKNKIILLLSFLLCQTTVFGQFFYEESCTQKTGVFTPLGQPVPVYTANTGIDPVGKGWLRLTNDNSANAQFGYVLVDGSYPSNLGLTFEFDFKIWSKGRNADGFTIFLCDASKPFAIGGVGGSLGYLGNGGTAMKSAYLGVALDAYGTFAQYLYATDPTGPPPPNTVGYLAPNRISIAGPEPTYKYYGHAQLVAPNVLEYATNTSVRPSDAVYYRRLRIQIDPAVSPATGMNVTVYLKTNQAGAYSKIIGPNNVPNVAPANLKVGFVSSTATFASNHEVQNVVIKTSGDLSVYKSMSSTSCSQNNAVSVITRISSGVFSPITGVEISDTMPKGFQLIGFVPPAGYTAGTTTTAPDGRIVYKGTVNLTSLENLKLTRTGTITAAVSAVVSSAVSVKAPTGFADNNLADNYAKADMTVEQKLFSDDVWFFGNNIDAPLSSEGASGQAKTSKGIIFENIGGVMTPKDASKISMVNSWENTLSVSTPACSGSFIFYTQHNKVYNSKHEPMVGGSFAGTFSVADGLAAGYIGNNKYIFFSVSAHYGLVAAATVELNTYIIDMTQDGGLGSMTFLKKIAVGVSETIELIPQSGTYDKYWLVFNNYAGNKIEVHHVDGATRSVTLHMSIPKPASITSNATYCVSSNSDYSQIAFAYVNDRKIGVFNFDPLTGIIAEKQVYALSPLTSQQIYGVAFSPNQQFLYATEWQSAWVEQIDLTTNARQTQQHNTVGNQGGGIKLGPDGRMYITRQDSKWMAVINNPNVAFNAGGGGITANGFALNLPEPTGKGITISTGLTPPAICPPGANLPPIAKKHLGQTDQYTPVKVKVVIGDEDPENGVINLNSVRFTNPADDGVKGTASIDAATKEVTFSPNAAYNFAEGEKVQLRYIIKDIGIPVSMCDEGELEITIKKTAISSTLFSDDVWFFGNNEGVVAGNEVQIGTPKTSKGIIFKNIGGIMTPSDGSGISQVNSWENSLSVSTPACNGSFIFYASHNQVYNSLHLPMDGLTNGVFAGHTSNADGLAAAYLGDNKYLLVSVSNLQNTNSKLNYYSIDMSANGGLGSLITSGSGSGTIDPASTTISEGIEMIPVKGTYNQYWLVYFSSADKEIRTIKIDGSNPSAPVISPIVSRLSLTPYLVGSSLYDLVWRIQPNASYNKLALSIAQNSAGKPVVLLNFNPATGMLGFDRQIYTGNTANLSYGSFVFVGNYLFYSDSRSNSTYEVVRYNLTDNTSSKITINTPNQGWRGGGIKMGPDGKIYIMRQGVNQMAVITDPLNAVFSIVQDGFSLGYNGMGLAISTGLTPPWIDPPTEINTAPQAIKDVAYTYKGLPVTISPLANDLDDAGNASLNLTEVRFADPADAVKGTIATDAVNKKFTFTPTASYSFSKNEVIHLEYVIKDQGTPVQLCDQGNVYIAIGGDPIIQIKDSCSFKPKLYVDNNITVAYQWEFRAKPADAWTTMAGNTTYSIDGKTPGQYRVKISHVGTTTPSIYTPTITLVQQAKHNMGYDIFYSMEIVR